MSKPTPAPAHDYAALQTLLDAFAEVAALQGIIERTLALQSGIARLEQTQRALAVAVATAKDVVERAEQRARAAEIETQKRIAELAEAERLETAAHTRAQQTRTAEYQAETATLAQEQDAVLDPLRREKAVLTAELTDLRKQKTDLEEGLAALAARVRG